MTILADTGPVAAAPRVACAAELCEAQYNLRAAFPDFPQVLEGWREASARVRTELKPTLDLAYGPEPLQRLDLYRAAGPACPLLVFIHGGYWQSGDKSDIGFIARPYVQAGISVAVMNYSLAPDAGIEKMVAETRDAVTWLAAHATDFSLDAQRISLMGHSAGAHLASVVLAQSALPGAASLPPVTDVFAVSGVFDLRPLLSTSINHALSLDAERARALSVLDKHAPSATRVHTFIGEQETPQFHLQAAVLKQCWPQVGSHHVVRDTHHYTVLHALADTDHTACQAVLAAIRRGAG